MKYKNKQIQNKKINVIIPNFAAFKYEIQKQTNTKQNMGVNIPNLAAFKYEIQIQTNTKQNIDVNNNSTGTLPPSNTNYKQIQMQNNRWMAV